MPTVIPITSLADDPRLLPYANQRDAYLRAAHLRDIDKSAPDSAQVEADAGDSGLFVAEGELVVRTLLHSAYEVRSLLVREGHLAKFERDLHDLERRTGKPLPAFVASQHVMDEIVGFHIHRGVLACGCRKTGSQAATTQPAAADARPASSAWSEEDLIANARTLVLLEDLSNHDNVGGIFRNIGCLCPVERTAALLSPRCCDPLYRKSLRVSMGHALRVPFAQAEEWSATLDRIEQAGFTIVAMETSEAAVPIAEVVWPERVALVLGAEGPGLRRETIARAGLRVRIPMAPGADSLNVATAAGIALSWMRLV
ncbi:MAG: RNA methyltransferase [Phycisphaeraceae bacterium]|nr:MAG: RNA methyltransferase [Phycisphaeraceae bacterium]